MLTLVAVIPSPDPLPMPAPPWLLASLLLLTFFLHVIPMNLVLGGSLIAAVARIRGCDDSKRLSKWIAKAMPTLVSATVTFGVAALLFLQTLYGRLFFSSAVLMAWLWFAVVPLVIVAYYGTYLISFRQEKLGSITTTVAAFVSALFLGVAFIYSSKMSLMLRPEAFLPMYLHNRAGTNLNLGDPTLIPRYLHMLLGAISVAGLAVAAHGISVADQEHGKWATRQGMLWFVVPTVPNLLVGLLWFALLPRDVMLLFMGKSMVGTLSFTIAVLFAFAALVFSIISFNARNPRPLVKGAIATTAVTLVAMVLMRDEVRLGTITAAGFRQTPWVEPQWGLIAMFLVLLIAALVITAWMSVVLLRSREETEERTIEEPEEVVVTAASETVHGQP